jgi:Fe-Mn family superoxide dismutase
MKSHLSRRTFLQALAAGVGMRAALSIARADDASPPPETGLTSEGLLAGRPGFQPRTVAPLPHEELPGFLSRAQLAAHHAEYSRTVDSLRAAEQTLATADRSRAGRAAYRDLRRTQVTAANDMLLHEFYFRNLARERLELPPSLRPHMREHMGSLESWRVDFTAAALTAKRWAALVYDPYDDRWHNAVMDDAADGVWIGANLLVVCDVDEHAYEKDFERREDYVSRFLEHVDWSEVAERYERVDRM